MSGEIWLVVGVQASGKSTAADLLARQFDAGVHVRGGEFYRWAVRGWVHHDDERASEARRLLDLRYRLSAKVADEYCTAGFTTVVQDNIYGSDVVAWLSLVSARPRHLVVLRPSIEVVGEREELRRRTTGKAAYREGGVSIEELDDQLSLTPHVGLWLDTSALSPQETVDEILRRRSEAIVDEIAGDLKDAGTPGPTSNFRTLE
ncbi:MAG TPA: AAA family ATPase [Acidimicrobiales bacterium]|nr:AAA family ATPase [Acidimicrobiales bacterium]